MSGSESDPEISFTIMKSAFNGKPRRPCPIPVTLDIEMLELTLTDPTSPPTTPTPRLSGPHLQPNGSEPKTPTTPTTPPKLSGPHRPKPSSPSDQVFTSPTSPSLADVIYGWLLNILLRRNIRPEK